MIRELTVDEALEVVGGDPAKLDAGNSGGGGFGGAAIAIGLGAAGSALWDGVKAVVGAIAGIGNSPATPTPPPAPPPIEPRSGPTGGGGPNRYI